MRFPHLPPGAQPLSPPGQFLTLGVARTPGVFHAASHSCEFDLDGDEDDLREHCSCFCFDRGWVHHFLQHQGANLAFVCIVKGQYHCHVHEIPPIKRTPAIFLPIYRRKLSAPVTSPRWQGRFMGLRFRFNVYSSNAATVAKTNFVMASHSLALGFFAVHERLCIGQQQPWRRRCF